MKQITPILTEILQAIVRLDNKVEGLDNKFDYLVRLNAKTKAELQAAINRSQDEIIDTICGVVQIVSEKHDDHERRLVKLERAASQQA